MACMGLKNLTVTVTYTGMEIRPICLVEWDKARGEINSYVEEVSNIEEATEVLLERCSLEQPSEDRSLPSIKDIFTSISSGLFKTSGVDVGATDGVDPTRIHLVEACGQADVHSNGPPVRLIVRFPEEKAASVRQEHFVIDDFWEFVQIKFENVEEDLLGEEKDNENKYAVAPGTHSPELQEMVQLAMRRASRKAEADKKLFGLLAKKEDELVRKLK
ncbi:hypothetical protein SCHPADRAFT_664385 [Schizopora paradoxa]|uniref:Uncharacterized protein n=1 Tax=Schizopora paradoxa TaxID=27342 RepID=A0A0H2R5I6_9AGAM|nr:hypothetical protein SCHPADRAFT_664385 [Schizopora paradoxa]